MNLSGCFKSLCKTWLAIGLGVGAGLSLAHAQEEKPKPTGRPRIEIEPKSLNLGAIFVGEKGKGQIIIKNTGTAPLKISRTQSSCGCTAVFLENHQRIIPPGGSSVLSVTMRPKKIGKGEIFAKTVTIFSNDAIQPTLPIRIECEVLIGVDVTPYTAIFRKLRHGEVRTVELKLTSMTEEEFHISSIDELPGPVLLEFDPKRKARTHTVKITAGPMPDTNNVHNRIRIHTTHSKTPLVEAMLLIDIEKLVEVIPNWLNLGRCDPGQIVEKQITVRATGGHAVETIEPKVSRYAIEVSARKIETDKPDQWMLSFKVPQDLAGRKVISPLILTTNIKEAGPIKVNMSLKVNSKPVEEEIQ